MTVRKSCYYTVLSRRYALRWIYFYLNIFIFEIYTQQRYESDFSRLFLKDLEEKPQC